MIEDIDRPWSKSDLNFVSAVVLAVIENIEKSLWILGELVDPTPTGLSLAVEVVLAVAATGEVVPLVGAAKEPEPPLIYSICTSGDWDGSGITIMLSAFSFEQPYFLIILAMISSLCFTISSNLSFSMYL